MRIIVIAGAALGLLSVASAAKVVSGAEAKAVMHERHEGMEKIGKAMKALSRQIKSGSPDMGVVKTNAASMNSLAGNARKWFPQGTGPDVGKTGAKPEIWQHPADFAAKMKDFQVASATFDRIARSGNVAATNAAFGPLGKSCKSCHDDYRKEMHH